MKKTPLILNISLLCLTTLSITSCKSKYSNGQISNNGFEASNDRAWNNINKNSEISTAYAFEGTKSLRVGNSNSYSSSVAQKIKGLKEGYYYLEAYALNEGNQDYCYIYGNGSSQSKRLTSIPRYTSIEKWVKVTVRGIYVSSDGILEIGIESKGENQYCYIDNFSLNYETIQRDYDNTFGGAVSWLDWEEDMGAKYYTQDGVEKDALQIMSENGCNAVRLELYNNPGDYINSNNETFPKGYKDADAIFNLAKRASSKGMKIQLSFMYSDYWSNEAIPSDWMKEIENVTDQSQISNILTSKLYTFTKTFMQRLADASIFPEYVSLGNEMEGGILLPYGSSTDENTISTFCSLMDAGYRAVKEVSPNSRIILHTSTNANDMFWSNKQGGGRFFFDICRNNNIKYDIIGLSYYPFWAQTDNEYAVKKKLNVDDLVEWCNMMIDIYDKDIFVMESGYNWGTPGQLSNNGAYQGIYPSSKEGQRDFMLELINGIKTVKDGRCLGDLYWDPILVRQNGIGYAVSTDGKTIPNCVETTTFFDFSHYALPVLNVYKYNTYVDDAVLYGQILDKSNKPLINSKVILKLDDKTIEVNTDKYGYYRINVPVYKGNIHINDINKGKLNIKYNDSIEYNIVL